MNRLRELREEKELRQIDVSLATGIDQKTLSNYETGKTNPDSYALLKLADFFEVSIDYILGRVEGRFYTKKQIIKQLSEIQKNLEDIKHQL